MATATWVGTDAGNVGNYGVAANWSPSGVPGAGDDVRFTSGSQDVRTGLDQSAVNVNSFIRDINYTGKLGYSGNYLKIDCDGDIVYDSKGGDSYLELNSGATGAMRVHGTGATKGRLFGKGDCTSLLVTQGNVEWDSGTVATLFLEFIAQKMQDVLFTIQTATITALHQLGGKIIMEGAGTITTLDLAIGTILVREGTLTTLNQRGGSCSWLTDQTMTNGRIYSGAFTAVGDGRAKTITNLECHAGSSINLNSPFITLTNDLVYYGGSVMWYKGDTVGYI